MRAQKYWDLKKKHEQEITDFPIAFAFNKEQLKEALEKLGVDDVSECCTVMEMGDIVKKTDARDFVKMIDRHGEEIRALLNDRDLAFDIFVDEMDNHEYAINWDGDDDVLGCLSLDYDKLKEMNLVDVYNLARREHYKHAEEWGMI